jgi:PAS domain S-box-containing protein
MRVQIVAGSDENVRRARALIEAAGLEPLEIVADGPDVLVVAFPATAASDAPTIWLAEELTEEVAAMAEEAHARVCLWCHGARPLRLALLGAARDAARGRAAQASEQFRALVQVSVSDSIFGLNVEGERFRFREINAAFTRATGLRADQVVGRFVDEVIPEPSLSLVLERYRLAIAERRTVKWREITPYPTGRKVGEVSITPIIDGHGRCSGLIGAVHDITEEAELDERIRQYAEIVRAVQIGLTVWDVASEVTLAGFNPEAARLATAALAEHVGRPLVEIVPGASGAKLLELIRAVAADGTVRELPAWTGRDGVRTFSLKVFPLSGDRVGLAVDDVTAQAQARALKAAENRVLEMVASGETLERTMTALALAIEEQTPPSIASVLLLGPDGQTFQSCAAPHLSESLNRVIDGARIGPSAGSCGTAAALKRSVIVTDIELDPLWDDYREAARAAGVRACWSTPIVSGGGRVLGTFALYYREPRAPTAADLELIARACHVAGIAIQRSELDHQLRGLSARLEAAREEERSGIAREIHDQLGQTITVLKIELAWIARRARSPNGLDREALVEKVQALSGMTDEIIDQVRRISAELRPGILDDLGLAAALSWQAQEFQERTHIPCVVQADLADRPLSRDISTTVFRVFQEALTNVVRHADAGRVEVRLAEDRGALVLTVRDDGTGIRLEDVADPRSLGLLGISERARRLGGTATFAPATPRGTVVTLRLPLDRV